MRLLLALMFVLIALPGYGQADAPVRFQAIDIQIDPAGKPLAAYQLEFSGGPGVKIVGIEGGEHPAFAEPPFYDPKAMQHDRVILAAFSTRRASDLPHGRTRVATIHLQITGAAKPEYQLKLKTAADAGGTRFDASAEVEERKSK
jgi:hypothetical protein